MLGPALNPNKRKHLRRVVFKSLVDKEMFRNYFDSWRIFWMIGLTAPYTSSIEPRQSIYIFVNNVLRKSETFTHIINGSMSFQVSQDRHIVFVEGCKSPYNGFRIVVYSVWWIWTMFQAPSQFCFGAVQSERGVTIADLKRKVSKRQIQESIMSTFSSKSAVCSMLLGNPSKTKRCFPSACALLISLFRSCVVSWAGSKTDFFMLSGMNSRKGDVGLFASSLSKSPTEIW